MRWLEPSADQGEPRFPDLHPLVGQALWQRGIRTSEAALGFLDPRYYHPHPASDLPGMEIAVARVRAAIRAGEPICVWGDFDVDGQTATAILVSTLRQMGADVRYHVPVRASEGHGLHTPKLAGIIDSGASLVLTCDTGTTAHEAVEYAHSRGVDVVVTDHHDLGEALPSAVALVNPKLLALDHPLSTLAGAGVAYKLAEALLESSSPAIDPCSLLDLAAIGLIGDLALLRADTRYLVQCGLARLRQTERLGLKIMMEFAQVVPGSLNEEHVGFELAPRLNALGRLGDANPGVDLLLTDDPGRARVIATQLEGHNSERKLLTQRVHQAAEAQLQANPELLAQPVIILAHAGWHGGVIGLAATRIAHRYGKPAILFSIEHGLARGSARSIEGLHITRAIAAQRDILRSFGGHPMAAGLALDSASLPRFRRALARTVAGMLADAQIEEAALQIEGWLDLAEIGMGLTEEIERLAPFGAGNKNPILATRRVRLISSTTVGRSAEHLKLTVEDEMGRSQTVLWWGGAGEALLEGTFDLAYTLRTSDFRGSQHVTAEFVDWRQAEEKAIEVRQPRQIVDWRANGEKEERLRGLLTRDKSVAVWAEGKHRQRVGGVGRHELQPAATLVVWTAPAEPATLHAVLKRVQPTMIIVVALDPEMDEPRAFLERLGGLLKYAIQHKGGQTTWDGLATATAQREAAVRLGVEWLAKRGQIQWQPGLGGELLLAASGSGRDDRAADEIQTQIQQILNESGAYRAYFMRAEKPVE